MQNQVSLQKSQLNKRLRCLNKICCEPRLNYVKENNFVYQIRSIVKKKIYVYETFLFKIVVQFSGSDFEIKDHLMLFIDEAQPLELGCLVSCSRSLSSGVLISCWPICPPVLLLSRGLKSPLHINEKQTKTMLLLTYNINELLLCVNILLACLSNTGYCLYRNHFDYSIKYYTLYTHY